MTIKMTYEQVSALTALLKVILAEPYEDAHDRQQRLIIHGMYCRMRVKTDMPFKGSYAMKLSELEAITWQLFFKDRILDPSCLYETNIINQQLALIDQTYG